MREAFEWWAVVEGLPVNKGSKKEYLNVKTRLAWRAWKAGSLANYDIMRADGVDMLYASKASQWDDGLLAEVNDFADYIRKGVLNDTAR